MKKYILLTILFITNVLHASEVENLQSLYLSDASMAGIMNDEENIHLTEDQKFILGLRTGKIMSQEGLALEKQPADLLKFQAAYSAVTLIARTNKDAQTKSLGERILFYEKSIERIVRLSQGKANEELIRITLNRSLDIGRSVISSAGNNSALVAQWLVNFYESSFAFALKIANDLNLNQRYEQPNMVLNLNRVGLAKFGIQYADKLFELSASLTSRSSKAIILAKLVSYLGWDTNLDLRRREYRETIVDIYTLQREDDNYKNVIEQIRNDQEPTQSSMNKLRVSVFSILETARATIR